MTPRGSCQGHVSRPVDPMAIETLLNDNASEQQTNQLRIPLQAGYAEHSEFAQRHYIQPASTYAYSVDQKNCQESESAREKRDSYNEDQKYFIWYHRIVLGRSWERIEKDFLDHFGQRRSKSGLQCRFYRVLSEKGSGKIRDKVQPANRCSSQESNVHSVMGRGKIHPD